MGESLPDYARRLGMKVNEGPAGGGLIIVGCGRSTDSDGFVPRLWRSMRREK
jgi:hypothetical protein